jgi:hypothetical protein
MIAPDATPPSGTKAAFEFEELEAFSCGCVAARFRVLPWTGHILRIEAKGPYCPFDTHESGAIVGLGIRSDALSSDDAGLLNPTDEEE